jgi:hypothetical protein
MHMMWVYFPNILALPQAEFQNSILRKMIGFYVALSPDFFFKKNAEMFLCRILFVGNLYSLLICPSEDSDSETFQDTTVTSATELKVGRK